MDGTDRNAATEIPALEIDFNWSFSNLVAPLRQQLFVYRDLFPWLNDPYQAPPALAGVHDANPTLDFHGF